MFRFRIWRRIAPCAWGLKTMKKLETKSMVLLKHHLKALKLPTIHAECEKVAGRCAQDNVDHLGFLLQLCELELIEREKRAADRRLKAARFPNLKTLDTFDFTAQPSSEPAAGDRVDAMCVSRQPGNGDSDRESRHREDARGHGVGGRGLRSRQTGAVLEGDGVDHPS